MQDPFSQFIDHFNRGDYRACVDPLEEIWSQERDDFHKGLIRICVGLHQLRLGLLSSPRFLLQTAAELLRPYAPAHRGLQLAALLEFLEQCLALIPAEESGSGQVRAECIPAFQLKQIAGDQLE